MERSVIVEILTKANILELSGLALDRAFDIVLEECGAESELFREIDCERAARME